MATYTLPNTQTGGSQSISAPSMQAAQQQAQAAGTWSSAAGTYGANSGGGGGGTNPVGGGGDGYADPGQTQNFLTGNYNAASLAAQTAYNNAKLQGDAEDRAFAKAQEAYKEALSTATTFGTSPGGPNMPAAGTPTMAQVAQWGSMYGTGAAPTNQYQPTLAYQKQLFDQQQTAANNYAALSGYYTPQGYGQMGTMGAGVNLGQIDQALSNALGAYYNQSQFQQMTQGLQNQGLTTDAAMQAVNAAIRASSGGRLQGFQDIAGSLGAGAWSQTPAQAQTMAMQKQQAELTGMTNYQPYSTGQWLYDPSTGTYGQVSANGQVRSFTDLNSARQAGMPTADWNNGQVDPARVVQTSSANNWGGIGQQGASMAYQQQLYDQALNTAKFQQGASMDYLKLLSGLQGPADYGQYLRTLGSTPQGLQGLTAAAAGAYLPGGGTTGVAPQGQTLNNFVNQATGGISGGGTPATGTSAGATGGTGTTYQDFMNAAQKLPTPSQLAPQALANMTDSQKQILQSMYGQLGYTSQDVQSLFNQSLPKYSAGGTGGMATGSYKLQ